MKLDYQRRVSADLLKCGVHRVWIDDRVEIQERISEAVTRDDIRQNFRIAINIIPNYCNSCFITT